MQLVIRWTGNRLGEKGTDIDAVGSSGERTSRKISFFY